MLHANPTNSAAHKTPSRGSSRRLGAALLCVVLLAGVGVSPLTQPAAAATPAELRRAEALAMEAKAFFRTKLYKDAALQFMEAFALSQRPNLVYNAARAYEEGGYQKKAVALFRHYLSLAEVDEAGKAAARTHLNKLEAQLAAQRAKVSAQRAAREREREARALKQRQAQAAEAKLRAAKRRAELAALRKQAGIDSAPRRHVDPWWVGASAAALVTSGVAYGVALTVATDLAPEDVIDNATRDRYLQNKGNALIWRGFSVGAGVIGVSLAGWTAWKWYTSAPSKSATRGSIWLMPSWSPVGHGLVAGLRF